MTNSCYYTRLLDGYCVYRVKNPVELNLYYRKRIIHKGRIYWFSLDVLYKIHEIYRTMEDTAQYCIRRITYRIMHFMRIVCKVAKIAIL